MTGKYYIVTIGKTQTVARIEDRRGNGWIATNLLTSRPLYFVTNKRLTNEVRDMRVVQHLTGKEG